MEAEPLVDHIRCTLYAAGRVTVTEIHGDFPREGTMRWFTTTTAESHTAEAFMARNAFSYGEGTWSEVHTPEGLKVAILELLKKRYQEASYEDLHRVMARGLAALYTVPPGQ